MPVRSKPFTPPLFLGIEGGGTRTIALMVDSKDQLVRKIEIGPGNLRLLGDGQLISQLRSLRMPGLQPNALAIGMAGARNEADWERIRRAAGKVWVKVPCYATNDLETALMAAQAQWPKVAPGQSNP